MVIEIMETFGNGSLLSAGSQKAEKSDPRKWATFFEHSWPINPHKYWPPGRLVPNFTSH